MSRRRLLNYKGASQVIGGDNFVRHYRLDETSGTTVVDDRGNGDAVNNGCVVNSFGKLGTAYRWDNNTDNIQIPYSPDIDFSPNVPFSLCFWFYFDPSIPANCFFIGKSNGTNRTYEVIKESTILKFRISNNNSASNRIEKTIAIATNQTWFHYTATYDGTASVNGMKVYLNGSDSGTTNTVGTYTQMGSASDPVWIGKFPTLTNYSMQGNIDDIRIFKNHVLTQAEIDAIIAETF